MRTKIAMMVAALISASLASATLAGPAAAQSQFEVLATINVGVNPFGDQMAPNGETVWVSNFGSVGGPSGNTVRLLNTSTYNTESVIGVGNSPEDIGFAYNGSEALVTNSSSATVSVINAATRTVTQTVSLASLSEEFPFGVIATKDSKKVFVTSEGGERDKSVSNIAILNNPYPENVFTEEAINGPGFTGRPALTPDGKLLVVPRNRGDLAPPETLIINPETNQIVADLTLSRAGATQSATVTPDGRFAYVSILGGEGGVWVINLETLSTATVIPTPDTRIFGVTATPDGRYVFATDFLLGEVSVISTETNQIVANVPVGSEPNDVAITPNSTKAFVTNQGEPTVSVISIPAA